MSRVLVLGATGCLGRRLVPRLLAAGHKVQLLARDPAAVASLPWGAQVAVVQGDAFDPQAVMRAGFNAEVAVCLVHPIEGRLRGLVDREERMAAAIREGCDAAGLRHLVYLGGLADEAEVTALSDHMYGRLRFGQVLADGPLPVTELRAAIVVANDSASFRLLRAAASVPVRLNAPPGAHTRCQPVAAEDVVAYLAASIDGASVRGVVEIGGPDVLTYAQMVAVIREEATGAAGVGVAVPYLPPEAGALPLAAVSEVDVVLATALLSSARHDAVVQDPAPAATYGIVPRPFRDAVREALVVRP